MDNYCRAACYQYPRTGNNFIDLGVFTWTGAGGVDWSEYAHVKLKSSLISNHVYTATYYVNLIDASEYAIDEMGVYLDTNGIQTCYYCPALVLPQVKSPSGVYLIDTINWMKVQGCFIATGNETYLTLGNFRNNTSTNYIVVSQYNTGSSNYYLDDVSIIESNSVIKADNDTIINIGDTIWLGKSIEGLPVEWYDMQGNLLANSSEIKVSPTTTTSYVVKMDLCGFVSYDTITVYIGNVGMERLTMNDERLKVYPNPANQQVNCQFDNNTIKTAKVQLCKIDGRVLQEQTNDNGTVQFDVSRLSAGVYFITFINLMNNEKYYYKVLVQHE